MINTAIILSLVFFLYNLYVSVIFLFVKMGTIFNTPNEEVFKLRSQYKVKIKTFRKTGKHYGYCWGNTIYLNESLFKTRKGAKDPTKALRWTFHHEYYHLKHHWKKAILMRFGLSVLPFILVLPLERPILVLIYVVSVIGYGGYMGMIVNHVFEDEANKYANEMILK